MGEKSGNKKCLRTAQKYGADSKKRQFFHINHRECRRQAHLRPEKSVLGIKLLQFLMVGMFCPLDGKLELLERALVRNAANTSPDRGQPEML